MMPGRRLEWAAFYWPWTACPKAAASGTGRRTRSAIRPFAPAFREGLLAAWQKKRPAKSNCVKAP